MQLDVTKTSEIEEALAVVTQELGDEGTDFQSIIRIDFRMQGNVTNFFYLARFASAHNFEKRANLPPPVNCKF